MAKKEPTKEELIAEIKFLKSTSAWNSITKIVITLIRYSAFVGIAWFIYLSIDSLAGLTTNTNISIQATGELNTGSGDASNSSNQNNDSLNFFDIALIIAITFGIAGIVFGRRESALRRQVIDKFHSHTKNLELKIDEKRSSSEISTTGDTRPEDE